ncbi:MAG: Asp-tRNA(Asn)/Glu-tRNA(Gln) amidotransferase subunit GatA [Candidatus Marinimicrobia bacterium]|nr:Asp-tRNA(Asn)/Glu-tRNA(Gln) amidotransferase subunit GatA [Candidatus Neomarinimicrobiota bacterium]
MSISVSDFLTRYRETRDLNIMLTVDEPWLEKHVCEQSSVKGPLSGKLIVIKDNINVKGLLNTCGSAFLKNYISPYDATVVERIKKAGGIIAGKANQDEFAMGSSTEYSAFGPTKNPVNPEYVPGGSSGGSAAAVAAGLADYALGSDTGGSIRQPAGFCGVVGLKPTYGRVSRYGLTAFASSLDQIGPITRSVRQAAELLQVIAGKDERDATSTDVEVDDYAGNLGNDNVRTLGVPFHLLREGLHPEVKARFEEAVAILKKSGKEIRDITLPHLSYSIAVYYILATAEASSNLARFDGVRYGVRSENSAASIDAFYSANREKGFGPEVKRRIMLGTYVLSSGYYDAYYGRAQKVRRLIYEDFQKAFRTVDAILLPTCPTPAFKLGENVNNPMAMYLSDIFTVSVNIAGIPGLSVPVGNTEEGLPVGMQILGNLYEESRILQLGHALETLQGSAVAGL